MSLPLAIVDYRLPQEAISVLQFHAEVFLFNAHGQTFNAVDGHPDIFLCMVDDKVVVAPNTPQSCIDSLQLNTIDFCFGERVVGFDVESSTPYNCVVTKDMILHKRGFTDVKILELCANKLFVDLPQPFTRCSLFVFGNDSFITSDRGVYNVLMANDLDICFVEPFEILLPPYKNGFIGGCLGVYGNSVFLSGSIANLKDGDAMKQFIEHRGFELVELFDGKLLDVGGMVFL